MDVYLIFFLMIRRPPGSTRTDTLFPTRRSSDLYVKAEHIVVPDLQRLDAGRLAIARLQRGDCPAAVARSRAQLIKRGVIALRDEPSGRGIDRRQIGRAHV